jgi:hypothetical protein
MKPKNMTMVDCVGKRLMSSAKQVIPYMVKVSKLLAGRVNLNNKNMKKIISIICLAAFYLLPSCSSKPEYPFPHPLECSDGKANSKLCIPQDVKDYCFFKAGTYWVYIDSLSGIKDCVYVTSSFIKEIDRRNDENIDYKRILENMRVETTHSYDQFKNYFETTTNVPGLNANVSVAVTSPGFVEGRGYFFYPYTLDINIDRSSNFQFIIKKQNSINVRNKVYTDIFRFYAERDGSARRNPVDASPEHTYYLARNIGLVKSVIRVIDTNNSQNTFNRVWLLQNYKIVQ